MLQQLGLEPRIFCSVGRRLIHWAIAAIDVADVHQVCELCSGRRALRRIILIKSIRVVCGTRQSAASFLSFLSLGSYVYVNKRARLRDCKWTCVVVGNENSILSRN